MAFLVQTRMLSLCLDTGVLKNQTSKQRLQAKTLAVLNLLIKNGDKTTSNEDLIETIWEGNQFVAKRGIINAIAKLRKAFSELGHPNAIKNVPKIGYYIEPKIVASLQLSGTISDTSKLTVLSNLHALPKLLIIGLLTVFGLAFVASTSVASMLWDSCFLTELCEMIATVFTLDRIIGTGGLVCALFFVGFNRLSKQFRSLVFLSTLALLQALDFMILLLPSTDVSLLSDLLISLMYGHFYLYGPLVYLALLPLVNPQIASPNSSFHLGIGVMSWLICDAIYVASRLLPGFDIGQPTLDVLSLIIPLCGMAVYLERVIRSINKSHWIAWVLRVFQLLSAIVLFIHIGILMGLVSMHWQAIMPAFFAAFLIVLMLSILRTIPITVATASEV